MARAKSNGNGKLEEALSAMVQSQVQSQAVLTQTQALFNQTLAALNQTQAAYQARIAEIDARVAEISQRCTRIEALVVQHNDILQKLTEVLRDKIGFKSS